MKNKYLCLLISAALVLSLFVSCSILGGNNDEGENDSNISAETGNDDSVGSMTSSQAESGSEEDSGEEGSSLTGDVMVAEQVLADQDGVTVTLTGMHTDGLFGPGFDFLIENSTVQNLIVAAEDVSVNEVMIDPYFAPDVAAGKKANGSMDFFSSDLEIAGIETIQSVELRFRVYDDDSWEDLFETGVLKIETSAAGTFEQTYNDAGTLLYDENGVRIVAQELDSEDSFWGADIYLYIENNLDQYITISAQNVSINGYMVDPLFSESLAPGKKSFSKITFMDSDLENNNIETISEMELSFSIYDSSNYNTIVETSPISVSFD